MEVRLYVGKALAADASEPLSGAGAVVDAVREEVVMPELELGQIPVQVLLTAMLIDALHAAL